MLAAVTGEISMATLILAWVIGLLGVIMILGGTWGVIDVLRQEAPTPHQSYGGAVSMMCGGFAMLGLGAGAAYTVRPSYCGGQPLSEVSALAGCAGCGSTEAPLRAAPSLQSLLWRKDWATKPVAQSLTKENEYRVLLP